MHGIYSILLKKEILLLCAKDQVCGHKRHPSYHLTGHICSAEYSITIACIYLCIYSGLLKKKMRFVIFRGLTVIRESFSPRNSQLDQNGF